MRRQTRRRLLQTGLAGSLTAVAGCLGGSEESPAQGNGETNRDDSTALGDERFYSWLGAPIGEGTVEDYGFRYFDSERLREVADLLPEESLGNSNPDIIPGEGGTVTEQLWFALPSVAQNPDYQRIEPLQLLWGEFDRERVTTAIENNDRADWDTQTEYEGTTLFVDDRTESEQGWTWGVGSELFLVSAHVLEDQGTRVAERFLDTSAGQSTHVREQSAAIERMLEQLRGETIVEFFYGDAYGNGSGDGPAGVVQSYTITRETTERQFMFAFSDSSAVDEQLVDNVSTGFTEDGYEDVSTTEDGAVVAVTGTAETASLDRIRSLL